MIEFHTQGHVYKSTLPDNVDWISATKLLGSLKSPFNAQEQAPKSHRNRNSKWYMIPVEDILQAWDNERNRATELGKWYHDKREQDVLSQDTVDGLPVIRPIIQQDVKIAPKQFLTDGIYPEHLVYLQSAGICGQSDIVRVQDGKVYISDYKTSKEITTEGYTNWEGVKKKMSAPLQHIEDCHLSHYSIQLSLYMYIILRHNPQLQAGHMHIDHITFVEAGRDKYDYPIYHRDDEGNPIVKEIIKISVPYLHKECVAIINWLKTNRNKITKHA